MRLRLTVQFITSSVTYRSGCGERVITIVQSRSGGPFLDTGGDKSEKTRRATIDIHYVQALKGPMLR